LIEKTQQKLTKKRAKQLDDFIEEDETYLHDTIQEMQGEQYGSRIQFSSDDL
jgi:hypothetical protein